MYGCISTSFFIVKPSLDRLPAKAEDPDLVGRQLAIPHRMQRRYFKNSGVLLLLLLYYYNLTSLI